MKSAYVVSQGYTYFRKMVWMAIIYLPRFRIKHYSIFRALLVLDPESKEVFNCHPYQFFEICIPL